MIVDRGRVEDSHHAVMEEDEGDGHQEGRPFLVEGQEPDHHEEMEVELDIAAGEMDEDGR